MKQLDRSVQLDLLTALADHYPNRYGIWKHFEHLSEQRIDANLAYLEEHGLLETGEMVIGRTATMRLEPKITAAGMDFLADDGGLSAILGVVTIKIHDDTIKSLVEGKILESDLPPPEKQRYLDQLRELPAETTKHLVLKLVDLGLEKGPAAISAIGTLLFP
jgi:DNA-binding PadR family transcriptional regulator